MIIFSVYFVQSVSKLLSPAISLAHPSEDLLAGEDNPVWSLFISSIFSLACGFKIHINNNLRFQRWFSKADIRRSYAFLTLLNFTLLFYFLLQFFFIIVIIILNVASRSENPPCTLGWNMKALQINAKPKNDNSPSNVCLHVENLIAIDILFLILERVNLTQSLMDKHKITTASLRQTCQHGPHNAWQEKANYYKINVFGFLTAILDHQPSWSPMLWRDARALEVHIRLPLFQTWQVVIICT